MVLWTGTRYRLPNDGRFVTSANWTAFARGMVSEWHGIRALRNTKTWGCELHATRMGGDS
jgi:hypothetical protein